MTHETEHGEMQKASRPAAAAATPTVDIHFEGLFFFCFKKDASKCEAGIVTLAPGHELSVMVSETRSDGTQVSQTLSFPPLVLRLYDRFDISSKKPSVGKIHLNGDGKLPDRNKPNENEEYFGWVIDFENDELYKGDVFLTKKVFKPVIHINAGEFYTARRSTLPYDLVRIDGTIIKEGFGHVAKTIGLRINLESGGETTIDLGLHKLTLPQSTGSTYRVCFDNRRPEHKRMDEGACWGMAHEHMMGDMTLPMQDLSDLQYYYHAFKLFPSQWYDFRPKGERAVDPAICYSSAGSRTEIIS